jgi:hypothetical protein
MWLYRKKSRNDTTSLGDISFSFVVKIFVRVIGEDVFVVGLNCDWRGQRTFYPGCLFRVYWLLYTAPDGLTSPWEVLGRGCWGGGVGGRGRKLEKVMGNTRIHTLKQCLPLAKVIVNFYCIYRQKNGGKRKLAQNNKTNYETGRVTEYTECQAFFASPQTLNRKGV